MMRVGHHHQLQQHKKEREERRKKKRKKKEFFLRIPLGRSRPLFVTILSCAWSP